MIQQKTALVGSNYNMSYIQSGTGGVPVIFIHGIPTHASLWEGVIPFLNSGFMGIAIDQIGYGQSDRASNQDLTLPKQADYIVQLLDHLGIDKAHIVGHDLGGGITQILATNYPERVLSILITDGVCFSNWPLPEVVNLRYPTAPEFEPSPAFIERMLHQGIFHQKIITPQLLEAFTTPFASETGPQELKEASLALDHHQTEDIVPNLSNISVPATLLWGQYDRFLPPYWGLQLSQSIPNATFKILPECGHFTTLDDPALVGRELQSHLNVNP